MPHGLPAKLFALGSLCCRCFPHWRAEGQSGGVLEVAEALVAAGHQSIVISAGGRKVADLRKLGSQHVQRDIGTKSPLALRHIPWLRRFLLKQNVDVVDIHSRMRAGSPMRHGRVCLLVDDRP